MQPPRLLVHAPAAPLQVQINPQSSTLIESGVPGEPVSAHVDITYVRIVDGVTSKVPQPRQTFTVIKE